MNENDFLFLLQAKLDEAKSKGNINADIEKLQSQLDKLKIQATLDPRSAQNLADEIGKLINQKIVISNIGIDTSTLSKTGQQIGQVISDSAEKAIGNVTSKNIGKYFKVNPSDSRQFQAEMEKLVSGWTNGKGKVTDINIQTRTSYDKDAGENIERLHQATVTYKNELDEVIKKTIAWRQIGTSINDKGEEKILHGFVEVAGQYSKSIDTVNTKTDSFIEKQQKAVASAKNTLSSIESKLNDPNISKSLAGTDFDANGLNTQLEQVKSAISVLGSASRDTFIQAQIDVDKEITSLNNLISALKNAEYAATSLRTKDINTVKIDEGNNLNAFVQKMEQSGHYTDELKQKVENLRTRLNGVFDANTLTSYLNGLSNLQSEFKSVDATAKTLEKSTKLQTNIDAEKKILQVYTNELKEADVLTGDVKVKIQEMFHSLSKVDSQSELTTWRAELKGVKAETDAVLKSTVQEKEEEEKLANVMATVREKTEQVRQAEEKRQQETQNKAINKSLEEEYLQRQKLADQINKIQLSMTDKSAPKDNYELQVRKLAEQLRNLGLTDEEVAQKTKILTDAQAELKKVIESNSFDSINSKNQAILAADEKRTIAINQVKNAYEEAKLSYDRFMQPASKEKITTTLLKVQNLLKNNTRVTEAVKAEWQSYVTHLSNGANITEKEIKDINIRLKETKSEMQSLGKLGVGFFDNIKSKISSISSYLSASALIGSTFQAIRKGVSTVKELDDSLLELSKVSDLTAEGLADVANQAYELGEKVGKTGKQVIDAITTFKRAGFDLAQSTRLAEDALKMTNVAEGINEASDSAQYLISIMKGYENTSDEFSAKILDSINEVSNTQSIDFDNLADGAQRLSAVANQAGVSFDQMLGILTGGYEVLGNMEKTASGLITIFTRLQSIQLSDEEDVESVAKLQETFSKATNGVVNIVDQTTGQLRNAYDILKDLNTIWDTLDKNTQEGLAFAAGGTRQKSVFLSIMANWESVEKSIQSATDSMGSAEIENEKYLNSISGKMSQLSSSVEKLAKDIIESDAIKWFVDLGTTGVKAIDSLGNSLGGLSGIIGAVSGLIMNKNGIGERTMFQW